MRARTMFVLSCLASVGCTALIGVRDLSYDENAENGAIDGGASSSSSGAASSSGSSGNVGDGGPDGALDCKADLQTDPAHCGRCGHSCLGGSCTAGKCGVVTLATGLKNPTALALDATNVYASVEGDGKIVSVPKAGGTTVPLATGQTSALGVAVAGNVLFWTNADFKSDDAGTYKGGVWKCTLPACTDVKLVVAADEGAMVQHVGGLLYYNARNDSEVRRVSPDGTNDILLATSNRPFGLAADGLHVYYTSNQPNLYRALADGGRNEEAVGALDADFLGFVAVDDQRVYWAYTQENTGVGKVWGASKTDIAGAKIEYGPNKSGSVGVAVDATNIYWTNGGTFTGNVSNADGELLTCTKAGCPASGPVQLADKLPNPWNVAVDDVAVYWVEYTNEGQATGTVKKVAKP